MAAEYKAWWILKYHDLKTGKEFVFEWKAAVYHRTMGEGCPYLAGKRFMQDSMIWRQFVLN